ncbi:hypothetical protein [Myroides odoratimimus]|uniref:hypothetical protein n=1 Tax=Myroides odoratimimus TaxID=76832 RepID=UPI0031012826
MKKKLLFAGVAFMALSTMQAQDGVGIGKSIIPDGSAVLDIGATDKGLLIPRVALTGETDATTIKGAAPSLLVFNTATAGGLKPGYYFWLDNKWNALVSKTIDKTDEVLTTLEISADGVPVVLTYTGEDKKTVALPVAEKLQKDTAFTAHIQKLVSAKAAGVSIKEGAGIKVDSKEIGTTEAPLTEFTISAVPSGITLGGDVSGNAAATTVGKIQGIEVIQPAATNVGEALIYDGTNWKTGKPIVEIKDIKDKADLTGTGAIKVTGGKGAVLAATSLEIEAEGIKSGMIGAGEVKTSNIEDKAVTVEKITGGTVGQVLVSDANKTTKWVDQTAIVPLAHDVASDNSILVDGGSKAVLAATTIKVNALGITDAHLADNAVTTDKITDSNVTNVKVAANTLTVDKLATVDTNKNMHLTTDAAGKPQWESKFKVTTTAATTTATPVATDEVIDGKRVYTFRINDGKVEAPTTVPGLTYNSQISPITVPNIDGGYVLSAQVYNSTNQLLVASVADVTVAGKNVQFRFGMTGMYSTLPVASNYTVVLKYVSNEVVTP